MFRLNKQRSSEPFACLDLVLERWQSFLFQICFRAGLPLVSILRRSLGLPATALRGSLGSFKGSSLIRNGSCAKYSALHVMSYVSVLGAVLSDNVTFSCTLLGVLAYYSSNMFIQRPIFVVLCVRSILVVSSPASSVDVFYSIHLSV